MSQPSYIPANAITAQNVVRAFVNRAAKQMTSGANRYSPTRQSLLFHTYPIAAWIADNMIAIRLQRANFGVARDRINQMLRALRCDVRIVKDTGFFDDGRPFDPRETYTVVIADGKARLFPAREVLNAKR